MTVQNKIKDMILQTNRINTNTDVPSPFPAEFHNHLEKGQPKSSSTGGVLVVDHAIFLHEVLLVGYVRLILRVCAHECDTEQVKEVKECTSVS